MHMLHSCALIFDINKLFHFYGEIGRPGRIMLKFHNFKLLKVPGIYDLGRISRSHANIYLIV